MDSNNEDNATYFPGIVQMSELQVGHVMDEEAEELVHPSLRRTK